MSGIITYRGNFTLSETPPLDEKVAVITGGQSGIGREISTQLLIHKVKKLYILARNEEKYRSALQDWESHADINLQQPNGSQVEFVRCDLSDMTSAKQAAEHIRMNTDRLDILICNASDPIKPEYSLSPQGIESLFATNCVGHHILVALLLPLLRSTIVQHIAADVRIVITTSSLHAFCRELDFDLLTASTPSKSAYYDGIWRYARSKLANILYTLELSRRLMEEAEKEGRSEDGAGSGPSSRIFVNCFFPGNIATEQMDIWKRYLGGPFGYLFKRFWGVAGQTTLEAATTALFLAASPRVAEGEGMRGEYFIPIAKRGDVSPIAKDKELAIKLWEWTEKAVNQGLGDGWQA